ncbi:LPD7 domain-containing protein [Natronohydrobacter thiooxidans]|uniref:LPD7 domain-containing protein n=1 Tax=Natronohydrobacter thiooxidans TaxID=87172 RepID=UPI0008FF17F2|nr:LPD7 domain-containing protein [Natronohydrobacter thiooxidans]
MAGKPDAVSAAMGTLFDEGWTRGPGGRGDEPAPKSFGRRLGATRSYQHMARAAAGNRAVVVKLVRGGGCHDSRQLGNQLDYLMSKADRVFDSQGTFEQRGPLTADEAREAATRWSESWEGMTSSGQTAHLILSFPQDTDSRDVEVITERFCERMFEGQFDYIAATHSDRAHPHAHIVVNRRGEDGTLFTLRAGTDHSYEAYKDTLVELGQSYGVALEATSRLQRGIIHRAPTDAEYRRGRTTERPRIGADLDYARAQIARHAESYSALAAHARGIEAIDHARFTRGEIASYTRLSDLAQNLQRAASDLASGRSIHPHTYGAIPMYQQERFTQALERLDAVVAQAEDRIAAAVPGERPREEARLSDALSKLDALLPAEARDQELSAPPSEAGIYAAQNAAIAMEHVARVGEGRIRGAVEGSGISSDTLMARLREGAPTASLEQDWLMDDLRSVAEYHGLDLSKQDDLDRALEEVDRVHDRIGDDVGLDLTPAQREALEEKTSQNIQDAITALRREGLDRASISSRAFDIEDQARAEARAEVLGVARTQPQQLAGTEAAVQPMLQADRAGQQTVDTAKGPQADGNQVARDTAAGEASAESIAPARRGIDPLDTPSSYFERFVVTKQGDRQEFYRHYDDARAAIIDTGHTLSTKAADKATALDMAGLAAHRGWESMKVTGPQDFRREMWIEGVAKGIKVEGYKPNERDIEEAARRSDMERPRSLQRTDGPLNDRAVSEPRDLSQDRGAPVAASISSDKVDYSQGVRGTVLAQGTRPYLDRPGAAESPYVRLQLPNGRTHDVWGMGVTKALADRGVSVGDTFTLSSTRSEPVTITTRDPVTNELVEKQGSRRTWEAQDIQRGSGTETGTDTGTGTGLRASAGAAATAAAATGLLITSKSDLAKLPAPTDAKRAEAYREAVEERLTPDEIARLKQGDISGLEGVGSREDQLSVAREYLKAEGNSPQALRQVSEEWFDERAANAAQERGLEHD